MLTKLTGGLVYDPANDVDGQQRDIYIQDGRIVNAPQDVKIDKEYDIKGKVVMAGAIDLHTHIGGGKGNIARMLMPENHRLDAEPHTHIKRAGTGHAMPSTFTTGYRYAEMGYTAGFEPAVLPINARQAHMEMGDIPILGALFRSDRFQRQETELVVVVTPYIVKPVSAPTLALPTNVGICICLPDL